MKEDFLHYAWRFKKIDVLNLSTIDGEVINIIHPGNYNTDAGPDFLNAKVKINNTTWIGHVEMHINASDWNKHKHSDSRDYDNVILHVVWNSDTDIMNQKGAKIPCLILKEKVDIRLQDSYQKFISSQNWVACAEHISDVSPLKIRAWIEHLMVSRLEEKMHEVLETAERYQYNWEQVLFIKIAQVLGLKVNATCFMQLAESIPVNLLFKHSDKIEQLEALMFGQASMINNKSKEKYSKVLAREYKFLKQKYQLKTPKYLNWKLSRLRPANFPTIRISQLAHLYFGKEVLFDFILHSAIDEIFKMFNDIECSSYWHQHYLFGKIVDKKSKKRLGKARRELLFINAVVPLMFAYGKYRADQKYIDKSLKLLSLVPPEKNKIISNWKAIGITAESAFDTQALIHLKTRHCAHFKCLQCAIGHNVLNIQSQ